MKKQLMVSLFSLSVVISGELVAQDAPTPMPEVEAFAVLPAMTQASVSPDGKKLLIRRATSKNGDYILEVHDTANLKAEPIRFGASRMEMMNGAWLNNDKIYVSFRQNIQDGNSNYWVNKGAIVNANGKGDWLVPFPRDNAAYFSITSQLPNDPDHILLTYDVNNNWIPDVVKFNINNGRTQTVMRGNDKVSSGFVVDWDGEVRAGAGYDAATNSIRTYARLKGDDEWRLVNVNTPEDRSNFSFAGFSRENPDEIYVNANRGEDTTGIYLYNIRTGEYSERLFGLAGVDAGSVITSSKQGEAGRLLGFSYTAKWPTLYFTDAEAEALQKAVEGLFDGEYVRLMSRSQDDNQIVIYTESDKNPGKYYLLSDKKNLAFLGEKSPLLKPEQLGSVKYVKYTARDGRKVPAYVTMPAVGKKPYPTVVLPHGGPWARDVVIYDEWSQLLASHGYLVIQPQYRGSEGFGMDHWKAGDKKWGFEMQDDLDDAALYLVEKGLADKQRLMMFGWSYGGYAAFAGSMRENNLYTCTVAGAGVSDLDRIGASINGSRFGRILQGPTVKGVSPIEHVDKVNVPILVVHGDIDQRVPVEHSRLFVDKLKELNKDYKYLELKGADHFSNTLYYEHKTEFYNALLDWLDNKCQ
ncbi:S9 family peptidase [Bowmanella sp. JS7-9]|uniref:Alpha/beta hydrolase family protein n=1 Tax=Pseudobowmanella zhangzhouensis TaxID=1537679 RepID=A0ABW1XQI7_9ALTE|nr:prolyl oligopeptidase family serine peptidase [Bowmanella sp. JS7-9]TBX22006.1 peptidase S9 [Bowmanella sp. JS7-9]